jgi:protein SCO1/2
VSPSDPPAPQRRAPVRRVRALVAIALVSGAAIVGLVAGRLHADAGASTAPGLRADALPAGVAGAPAPRISLRDALGGRLDTRALRGRPYAVTFLYAHCPDVCPVIAQDLRDAVARLGPAGRRVGLVAVSVDPRGDTARAVRRFARRERVPASFRYGIGTRAQLAPVWRSYFVSARVSRDPEASEHTAAVWLVDARGRLRGRYPAAAGVPAGELAHDFRALLAER